MPRFSVACILLVCLAGCGASHTPKPGDPLVRRGDEIMVCGQLFHCGTTVLLWTDPGGYDAYRVERRFVPIEQSSWQATTQQTTEIKTPNRYGLRANLSPEEAEMVRGGGWPLSLLKDKVDQFVIHYDGSGISRRCFSTLQDHRDLSIHFMLDLDGTIYQTLDLKERAWHATTSNDRSVGVEIANVGAFVPGERNPFAQWYTRDADGRTSIVLPQWLGENGGLRTPNFIARPIRNDPVTAEIQGQVCTQYDLTPQQYDALIKLTATLCTIFPKIHCTAPRDASGAVINHKLTTDQLAGYQGLLGHYHIQLDKADPGPAFQWDRVLDGARKLMSR